MASDGKNGKQQVENTRILEISVFFLYFSSTLFYQGPSMHDTIYSVVLCLLSTPSIDDEPGENRTPEEN